MQPDKIPISVDTPVNSTVSWLSINKHSMNYNNYHKKNNNKKSINKYKQHNNNNLIKSTISKDHLLSNVTTKILIQN